MHSDHHDCSAETMKERETTHRATISWQIVLPRLKQYRRQELPHDSQRQAAVAVLMLPRPDGESEILFMKRAESPHDPWSGHMAFPGGRVDPEDASPFDAVIREVNEEIRVRLPQEASLVTVLDDVQAMARGRRVPLVITPFVFELARKPVLTPNEEVVETHWIPLSFFLDHSSRGVFPYVFKGITIPLPCYQYEGRIIWGLTYRMMQNLLRIITRDKQ